MDENPTVLVTGATGNVGGQVVAQLRERGGVRVRALTRRPESAGLPDDVEVVGGDLFDPESLDAALDGVDAVFLVVPALRPDGREPGLVARIARRARRVVYVSADGVPDDRDALTGGIIAAHATIEHLLEDAGVEWTFLRAGGMATNTLGWAADVRATGEVRGPYAGLSRSLVHEADVAAVGVLALTGPMLVGARPVLTGPEILTHVEQAAAIGDAIGRTVTYREVPRDEMRVRIVDEWGWPADAADAALDAWAAMVGNREGVTATVEELTGRPARSFRVWAADHAPDFR
ncbi:SDR family oxidoreductase [Isoptericola sp. NPDC057653]|uniref:SDR family oxidoreductase n=1 Tax=Isoptericola sp. NPDC057653 TaxID=3346195 RepID=UPI0036A370F3